jgi:UDP-N-acetylglucosamine diphosphorylase/glucosamine-1-phosphate N-acetyltransferase
MHLVVFEGGRWDGFAPLALGRPTFLLRCGIGTLLDRHLRAVRPARVTFWVRPALVEFCRQRVLPRLGVPGAVNQPLDDEPALILGGRTLHFAAYQPPPLDTVSLEHEQFVREAYVRRPGLSPADALQRTPRWTELMQLPQTSPQARWANDLWDLIHWNEEAIVNDAVTAGGADSAGFGRLPAGPYHVIGDDSVLVGPAATVGAAAVLDASRGPVVLGPGVQVGHGAVLQGPCAVGAYSRLSPLTVIGPGTSIGAMCHIGGNLDHTIVCDCVDKPHEGALGHSYIGDWVNIGGGTITANVKTTYGDVPVQRGSHVVKSGRWSLGCVIGDHSKTSIGTRLPPGCYVGHSSMLTGGGLVPKFVPSFTWWSDAGMKPLTIAKASEIAERVFSRRNRPWTALDAQLLQHAADAAPLVER